MNDAKKLSVVRKVLCWYLIGLAVTLYTVVGMIYWGNK
jgi:hypothetical protein